MTPEDEALVADIQAMIPAQSHDVLLESIVILTRDRPELLVQALREIVQEAIAEEREACAKVAEDLEPASGGYYESHGDIAAAIRARGQ
jgi:hypothetical protein